MPSKPILVADIGGTNARFALAADSAPFYTQAQTLQCADFETIEAAIDLYLKSQEISELGAICFAAAGPVLEQKVRFTNNNWQISSAELSSRYATKKVRILNDFESIAYSLPNLGINNISSVGGSWPELNQRDFNVAVLGPGSGLGVAGLCRRDGKLLPLITEGGHTGFAPQDELQANILSILQRKLGRVSNERLLSGPGLVNIYEALCQLNERENPGLDAAGIARAAIDQSDAGCVETLNLFFKILGQVAGDLALSIGATDGVFVGGGITQRYPEPFAQSAFRAAFEDKGRYQTYMQRIPSWLITHPNPGLLGSSVYARRYL